MAVSASSPRGDMTRQQAISDSMPTPFAPLPRGRAPEVPATPPPSLHAPSSPPSSTSSSSASFSFAPTSTTWPRKSSLSLLPTLPSSLSPPETSTCDCPLRSIFSSTLPQPTPLRSLSPSSASFAPSSLPSNSSSSFSSSSSLSSFAHSSHFSSSNISQLFSSPSPSSLLSSLVTSPISPDPLPSSNSTSSSSSSSYALDSSITETSGTNYAHYPTSPLTSLPPLQSNFTRSFSFSFSSSSSSTPSTSNVLPGTLTPEMARAPSWEDSSDVSPDLSSVASAQVTYQVTHPGLDFSGPTDTTLPALLAQPSDSYNDSSPLQTLGSTSRVTPPSATTSSLAFSLNSAALPSESQFPAPGGPDPILPSDSPSNELDLEFSSPYTSPNSTGLFLLEGSASPSNTLGLDYLDYNYTLGMCHGPLNSSAINSTSAIASSDDYNYDYCDSYYIFFWEELGPLLVVYGLTFLVGVVGNLLIIVVVRRNPRLHSATNMFLTSLATADLLFLLLSVPVKVAKLFSYTWSFGPVLCKLVHYVQNILVICSVLTLAAISVERYYGIVHPMKAVYKCTMSQAKKVIALVWLASFFLASPILVVQMHLEVGEAVRAYWCVRSWDWVWAWRLHETYLLLLVVCAPSVLMGAAYYKVCREVVKTYAVHQLEAGLWRKEQVVEGQRSVDIQAAGNTGRSRRDAATRTQVVRMLIVVVLMFVACWSPVMLIHVLQAWDFLPLYSTSVKHLKTFADFLSYANSCINPLVYGFMSRNFRDAFRCAMCGRRRRQQSLPRQWRWGESSSGRRTKTNEAASSVLRKEDKRRRGGLRPLTAPRTSRFSFRSSSWFSTATSPSASPDKALEGDSIRDSTYGDSLSFECPSVTKIGNIRLEFPSDCTVTLTVTQPDKRHRPEHHQCHPRCPQHLDSYPFSQVCRSRQCCPPKSRDSRLGGHRHHRHHFSKSTEVLEASSEYN